MKVKLTKQQEDFVQSKVSSGEFLDESDVIRAAVRVMSNQEGYESPALEAALGEGLKSTHRKYGKATLNRIRNNAKD